MSRPGCLSAATFGEQLVTGMSGCTALGRSRFGRRVSVIQEWWRVLWQAVVSMLSFVRGFHVQCSFRRHAFSY